MLNLEYFVIFCVIGLLCQVNGMSIKRSSERPQETLEKVDESAYKVNYDVYPIVFPKRAAMLLDRLMVALHHALEDEPRQYQKINDVYRHGQMPITTSLKPSVQPKYFKQGKTDPDAYYGYKLINGHADDSEDMEGRSMEFGLKSGDYDNDQSDESMDLQRRGHSIGLDSNQGRVYWRCYFNAVTCF